MLGPLNINLADFNVSCENGFLPDETPLERLQETYQEWEAIIEKLPLLLQTKSLRASIDRMQILSTDHLKSEPEWQRAYLILSFFTHGYIWEAGGPSQRLPPQITIPFLKISHHFDLPTTATYSALNLWNFAAISPDADIRKIENLRSLSTFTGGEDEEWFYLISVTIEAHGARVIPTMMKAIDAVRANESSVVTDALIQFSHCVQEIGEILKRMTKKCRPQVFYNEIRPFLAGSKNMEVAGLPNGVFYDEGEGKGQWRKYSGGSNAQSSLIQFFDVILGVQHSPTKGSIGLKNGFLREMRKYMPGKHREFLQHIESVSNIRSYAETTSDNQVTEAYNRAVEELKKFRDVHIGIVTRYIINPARQHSPAANAGLNLAVASANPSSTKELHGTGGTQLLPFLKQSRDETRDTRIP
ncbi:Indoleamine 2,3-dioxygenase [Mollisia scopiformis]|uniref:Indoleamine 2,3-dioxygenase n=1 Tax=Mollisia scopiformis TaxID=149040 RepID=A0A194XRV3_MOLSC|nr:Indoleamine 2,3-dioxygenase [Mollisia scopiformis]KUJ22923.1 Indoleamine 2,3-dioxygenase [Mollisia scopiformis]